MPRDTIKSLKAEIEALRAEVEALRSHVARLPQHDWDRPIGPGPNGFRTGMGGGAGGVAFPPEIRRLGHGGAGGAGGLQQ